MVLSAPKETVQVKITLGVKSFFFFLMLHMEGSCQLAAEKIACSANESKSNRDLFQIVSIHFFRAFNCCHIRRMPEGKHEGKAPFRGRFLSARTGSEVAFFPESHLQELLNSFPKLHLALGPGQLLQSHFPGSEDGKRALGFVPSTVRRLGMDATSQPPAVLHCDSFILEGMSLNRGY